MAVDIEKTNGQIEFMRIFFPEIYKEMNNLFSKTDIIADPSLTPYEEYTPEISDLFFRLIQYPRERISISVVKYVLEQVLFQWLVYEFPKEEDSTFLAKKIFDIFNKHYIQNNLYS